MMASRLNAMVPGYHRDWGLEGDYPLAGHARRPIWTGLHSGVGASLLNQLSGPY